MDIKLKRIELHNFKRYTEQTFEFDGADTLITAKNGYGKTTIKNAFLWCMTGKDEDGKTETTAIRTVGAPIEMSPEVIVTLEISDSQYWSGTTVFSRKLEATYAGRGIDKVYKGDATYCSIDAVPKSVTEYNAYVANLFPISPSIWLDIFYFADDTKFSADDRRKVLVDAFGQVSDESVKALNPDFAALFEAKGKLSVADFKTAQKEIEKSCTAELGRGKTPGVLQGRIDEAMKAIKDPTLSVAVQEQKIAELEAEIKTASSGAGDDLKARLSAAQKQLIDIDAEIMRDNAARHNAKYAEIDTKSISLSHKVAAVKEKKQQALSDLRVAESEIKICEAQIDSCKRNAERLEAEQPNIETVCPTCGRKLPKEKIDAAIGNYNEHKAAALEEYERQIKEQKDRIAKQNEIIGTARMCVSDCDKQLAALDEEVGELARKRNELMGQPIVVNKELVAKKAAAKEEIDALTTQIQLAGTGERIADLTARLRVEQSKLAEAQANERQIQRIAELKNRQGEVASMLSAAQRNIALCDEFVTTKARFIEQSIASHFEGVTFKLFDVYKNGEIKNACIPLVDGKPYRLLSFSQKILASVAILNGLSKHFGFAAPVFVDNCSELDAESMGRLATAGQKIIIKVSDGDFCVQPL